MLGADGKLRDASPNVKDILVGGKVHTPAEARELTGAEKPAAERYADKPRKPRKPRDLPEGKKVKLELRGGSTASGTIDGVYDRFYMVRLSHPLGSGDLVKVQKDPDSLDHRILPAKKGR